MEVREWKNQNSKEVALPSGLTLRVRRLSPFAMAKVGPIPKLEEIPPERNFEVAEAIVRAGLVSPSWGEGPDQVTIADFTLEEVNMITEAIMDITKRPDELPLAEGSLEAQQPS